jgi:hypothetical protein
MLLPPLLEVCWDQCALQLVPTQALDVCIDIITNPRIPPCPPSRVSILSAPYLTMQELYTPISLPRTLARRPPNQSISRTRMTVTAAVHGSNRSHAAVNDGRNLTGVPSFSCRRTTLEQAPAGYAQYSARGFDIPRAGPLFGSPLSTGLLAL